MFYDWWRRTENILKNNRYLTENGDGRLGILLLFAKQLLESFYTPVFLDGTFSSDRKAVIHASIVTTPNKIISLGLVSTDKEDLDSVDISLKQVINNRPMLFMTDEGETMVNTIMELGKKYSQSLSSGYVGTLSELLKGAIKRETSQKPKCISQKSSLDIHCKCMKAAGLLLQHFPKMY